MSGAAIGWAKRQKAPSPISKAILAALADYAGPGLEERDAPAEADGRHFCFVGVERLARETQYSVKTVSRHLARLVDAGLIARVRRMNGWTRTSDYTILACDGDGDRPFTEEERVLASALSAEQDRESSSGLTCEEDSQSPSGRGLSDRIGKRTPGPTEEDSGAPSGGGLSDAYVPYAGTTSIEPTEEPTSAAPERDPLTSPAFLIHSDGVSSGHTLSPVAEFGRNMREQTEEIMTAWQKWIGRKLPQVVVIEVSKIVKRCVGDGVERKAIALGLKDWTEAGMIAPKWRLEPAIAARVAEDVRRDPAGPPSKAQQREQRAAQVAQWASGKTAEDMARDLEQALLARSRGPLAIGGHA